MDSNYAYFLKICIISNLKSMNWNLNLVVEDIQPRVKR